MTTEKRTATCMLCEATCGIVLTVGPGDDGKRRVLRVDGDRDDAFSRGYICPKAAALDDVRLDPDRVTRPLRKTKDGGHAPISWDEALDEAGERLASILDEHGPHAVATYVGNPMAHSYAGILGTILLNQGLGSYSRFSATSADQLPQMLAALEMFGHQALMPVPDLERTRFLLVIGGNPLVSNGSIMTAPGMKRRLEEIRDRGGKIVVIDPRRTETARVADEHHFVVPGSDALLLLAMIDTIFEERLARPGALADASVGIEDLRLAARKFPAERVARHVGIEAETIRRLAREHAAANGAACYARVGACTQEFGGLVAWLAVALDVVTGNLDRSGGKMFTTPAVDVVGFADRMGLRGSFGRFRSRVRKLPEFGGELPVAVMAEEMTTEGPQRIRALITMAGNPVLSAPNGAAIDAALAKLDFMVGIDLYKNETTRHADLILPPTFGLEREHYDMVLYAFAVRNVARFAPAIFEPRDEARDDFDIMTDLALRVVRRRRGAKALGARAVLSAARATGPRRVLDGLLRIGPHRLSLKKLRAAPHGLDLGPLEPRLMRILKGRPIQVAPRVFLDDLPRLERSLSAAVVADRLLLIGRRGLRSNNSWMHNSARLTKGPVECTLVMHPNDARARGFEDGQSVVLRSRTGSVTVPLEVSDEIAPGVVSLPHGWGHSRAELRVAKERAGVSANDVTDESFVDRLTGTAAFSGVPVTVERAPSP
jgi:anaerobic selenocysteine-containing dehydrogenase